MKFSSDRKMVGLAILQSRRLHKLEKINHIYLAEQV